MAEFEIDGIKYTLLMPLKKSELDALHRAKGNQANLLEEAMVKPERGRHLFNHQGSYQLDMMSAAVTKCFGLKRSQIDKMPYRRVEFLYKELVKYSESLNW
jgi:adenosylmethionine-8-amino-7-oxononanoate aminotransferase